MSQCVTHLLSLCLPGALLSGHYCWKLLGSKLPVKSTTPSPHLLGNRTLTYWEGGRSHPFPTPLDLVLFCTQ